MEDATYKKNLPDFEQRFKKNDKRLMERDLQ